MTKISWFFCFTMGTSADLVRVKALEEKKYSQ